MLAAKIKIGWVNKVFKGETPSSIIASVSEYQDFNCLLMMARQNESKKGQKEVDKLEAFINKYEAGTLTMDDIKDLNIHLSIGDIKCSGVAENDEEISSLS